jgi:preprotein translocase subunit SecF
LRRGAGDKILGGRHDHGVMAHVMSDGFTNREGIQMTITRLILLVMAVFLVVFAIRVFGSRFLNK